MTRHRTNLGTWELSHHVLRPTRCQLQTFTTLLSKAIFPPHDVLINFHLTHHPPTPHPPPPSDLRHISIHRVLLSNLGGPLGTLVTGAFKESEQTTITLHECFESFEVIRKFLYCEPIDMHTVPDDLPLVADRWGLTVLFEACFAHAIERSHVHRSVPKMPVSELIIKYLPIMATVDVPPRFKSYMALRIGIELHEIDSYFAENPVNDVQLPDVCCVDHSDETLCRRRKHVCAGKEQRPCLTIDNPDVQPLAVHPDQTTPPSPTASQPTPHLPDSPAENGTHCDDAPLQGNTSDDQHPSSQPSPSTNPTPTPKSTPVEQAEVNTPQAAQSESKPQPASTDPTPQHPPPSSPAQPDQSPSSPSPSPSPTPHAEQPQSNKQPGSTEHPPIENTNPQTPSDPASPDPSQVHQPAPGSSDSAAAADTASAPAPETTTTPDQPNNENNSNSNNNNNNNSDAGSAVLPNLQAMATNSESAYAYSDSEISHPPDVGDALSAAYDDSDAGACKSDADASICKTIKQNMDEVYNSLTPQRQDWHEKFNLWDVLYTRNMLNQVIHYISFYGPGDHTPLILDVIMRQMESRLTDEEIISYLREIDWDWENPTSRMMQARASESWTIRAWRLLSIAHLSFNGKGCDVRMSWNHQNLFADMYNRAQELANRSTNDSDSDSSHSAVDDDTGFAADWKAIGSGDSEFNFTMSLRCDCMVMEHLSPLFLRLCLVEDEDDPLDKHAGRREVQARIQVVESGCGCGLDELKEGKRLGFAAQPSKSTETRTDLWSYKSPGYAFRVMSAEELESWMKRHKSQCGLSFQVRLYVFPPKDESDSDVEEVEKAEGECTCGYCECADCDDWSDS